MKEDLQSIIYYLTSGLCSDCKEMALNAMIERLESSSKKDDIRTVENFLRKYNIYKANIINCKRQ